MEITGKIKVINETQTLGDKGFKKREVVITTEENYPQSILIEFTRDKCELLETYSVGQEVKININIRGREWINPKGEAIYFNTIQGWRIEPLIGQAPAFSSLPKPEEVDLMDDDDGDLPF
ncbi:DUF3127 domain-containing protein [Brumimicrobium glaciale]|uniref:DUF3127 domain-containing protein n=1 Tax=Brumimicrobium glaciale TaxID=200475 RepID=A0A4Q4KMZ5_9FLAO|nr:DUF3127 domain-containing protein [Brumimicrobium glaciale]RYM34803.1 DUF3127 domain-containing protein [Brumimicrobium glaciale]